MTVCWMITPIETWKRSRTEARLISKLQSVFRRLLSMPDRDLARTFLTLYHERNCLMFASKEQRKFQLVARSHVMSLLRKTLLITLPDWKSGTSTPVSRRSEVRTTFGIVAATILPTLASSLSSSELSSLRTMRDRIRRDVNSVMQVAMTLPSAVFRKGSLSNRSLLAMSELSQAFRSSLSLSSVRQSSASMRNRMVTVESDIWGCADHIEMDICSRRSKMGSPKE